MGGLYPGGLISGCIFLVAGRWASNWGGGGAYKRQFTVFVLRTTYFCGATIS